MIIERKAALKIWESTFGKKVDATDFSDRKMNKSAFGQKNSKLGWTLSTLLPRCAGGREEDDNFICVHTETAQEKGESFPFFIAADKKYEITCDDENEWIIVLASDSVSIAEQEAKTASAMEKWNEILGECDEALDFCGRKIIKNEYMTDNPFAWKIVPYVEGRAAEGKNAYVASIFTAEESQGRTAFKANGKNYTLNKDNGTYYFKEIIITPPQKALDIRNPLDLDSEIDKIIKDCSESAGDMLDFIVVKAQTNASCSSESSQAILCAVSKILSEGVGASLAFEADEVNLADGTRKLLITYRAVAKSPADFEKIFLAARLLNTYSPFICQKLGIQELKIYNHAIYLDKAHTYFGVMRLVELYPEFKAFYGSIRDSLCFYEGEADKTLFVSNFIVYNVKFLSAQHPQNETRYYTEIYMVEHNRTDVEVNEALENMLLGESEAQTSEPVTENSEIFEKENASSAPKEDIDNQIGDEQISFPIADDDDDSGEDDFTIDLDEFK